MVCSEELIESLQAEEIFLLCDLEASKPTCRYFECLTLGAGEKKSLNQATARVSTEHFSYLDADVDNLLVFSPIPGYVVSDLLC